MLRITFLWLLLWGFLYSNQAKSFYAIPSNRHYVYYGLAWHPDKVWHSLEYSFQRQHWQFSKFKTVGANFQLTNGIKSFGLTADRGLKIRAKKHIKFWRLIVPVIGINPNLLVIEKTKSFNLKPRLGIILRSGWRYRKAPPQVNLKLCYGLDIPFGNQNILRYNPHEFSLHLGISFNTSVSRFHWMEKKTGVKF